MVNVIKQPQSPKTSLPLGKQRNYQEIVELLDQRWNSLPLETAFERMKKLDAALGSPAQNLPSVLITGTNGKSLTIHFLAQLLKNEGISFGAYYSPHILTYTERIALNQDFISTKTFTDLTNEVLNAADDAGIQLNSGEILAMTSILHFKQNNVDVAFFEASHPFDPIAYCYPSIVAVTRIIEDATAPNAIKELAHLIKKDSWVVSTDPSKINLQQLANVATSSGGRWIMPIRKLAPLPYPFEQLHGRSAALAERVAQLYMERFGVKSAAVADHSVLIKPKGQRGRPTLEAKKRSELNPRRSLEQFWKEELTLLPARFQLLDKEKPSVLLDTADNFDALKGLLLGVRLLHYQRPLKGLTLIMGANHTAFQTEEYLKLIRYFFKKTSGSIIFCPVENRIPSAGTRTPWDIEKTTNEMKNLKVKARTAADFKEAFELAKKGIDERHGLIVVAGSADIINEYWQHKGIKKL